MYVTHLDGQKSFTNYLYTHNCNMKTENSEHGNIKISISLYFPSLWHLFTATQFNVHAVSFQASPHLPIIMYQQPAVPSFITSRAGADFHRRHAAKSTLVTARRRNLRVDLDKTTGADKSKNAQAIMRRWAPCFTTYQFIPYTSASVERAKEVG